MENEEITTNIHENEIAAPEEVEENIEKVEKVEKEPVDVADVFENIKNEYERKIEKILVTKNQEIEKRDKIITELISGNSTEPLEPNINVMINEMLERRKKQYKY